MFDVICSLLVPVNLELPAHGLTCNLCADAIPYHPASTKYEYCSLS